MIQNTEVETSNYIMPTEECYDENGKIKKDVYMRQFPDFTKHDRKMTKKKINKFLEKNAGIKHFRVEILGTPYGCNIHFAGEHYTYTSAQEETFYNAVWEIIDSCVVNVKAFDFHSDKDYNSMEIWGIDDQDNSVILFLYTYDNGVIEIGENGQ